MFDRYLYKYTIDAKYKEVDIYSNINVSQSDIYQMLVYSIRYECKSIALIYPMFLGEDNTKIIESEILIDTNYGQVVIKIIKVIWKQIKRYWDRCYIKYLFK